MVDTEMVRTFLDVPVEEFPDRVAYEGYVSSGKIAAPAAIARFAAWLLLDVSGQRFSETDWDIRDTKHHVEWADSPLYPDA